MPAPIVWVILALLTPVAVDTVDTLPDNALYQMERIGEGMKLSFGVIDHIDLLQERIEEHQMMAEQNKEQIRQRIAEDIDRELGETEDELEQQKANGKDIEVLQARIQAMISKHIMVLEQTRERTSEQTQKGIDNALDNSKKSLQRFNSMGDKNEK